MFIRMVGGIGERPHYSLVARQLDGLVRDLVDDVERLERPARPRRLLVNDTDFFFPIHCFSHRRGAAGAVVRPARLEAHADADVRVTREEADRARPVGVPSTAAAVQDSSDRYAIRTRNLQDWNLTRYRCANRSKAPTTDAVAVHRDLRVARKSDILNDAAALALVLDARRGAFHANGATAQANLAADLLVDEGLATRCLLYTSPSPRDMRRSRMPSSA